MKEGPSVREKGLLDGELLGTSMVDRCSKLLRVVHGLREGALLHETQRLAKGARDARARINSAALIARQDLAQIREEVQLWIRTLSDR